MRRTALFTHFRTFALSHFRTFYSRTNALPHSRTSLLSTRRRETVPVLRHGLIRTSPIVSRKQLRSKNIRRIGVSGVRFAFSGHVQRDTFPPRRPVMRNPFIATSLSRACAGHSAELSLLDNFHRGVIAILNAA